MKEKETNKEMIGSIVEACFIMFKKDIEVKIHSFQDGIFQFSSRITEAKNMAIKNREIIKGQEWQFQNIQEDRENIRLAILNNSKEINHLKNEIKDITKNVMELKKLLEKPENMLHSDDAKNNILKESIDFLDLPVRPRHCLLAENINTVQDLIECTRHDLLITPNLGRKSLTEILDALHRHGLKLKD